MIVSRIDESSYSWKHLEEWQSSSTEKMEEYYQKIKEKKQKYITNKIIATKKNMEKIAIKFSLYKKKSKNRWCGKNWYRNHSENEKENHSENKKEKIREYIETHYRDLPAAESRIWTTSLKKLSNAWKKRNLKK